MTQYYPKPEVIDELCEVIDELRELRQDSAFFSQQRESDDNNDDDDGEDESTFLVLSTQRFPTVSMRDMSPWVMVVRVTDTVVRRRSCV